MSRYSDIINLPRHVSKVHPKMSMAERAAQFSPFAALTGYDDEIKEASRDTEVEIDESDETYSLLNEELNKLMESLPQNPKVSITYFEPYLESSGGKYRRFEGVIKKIDTTYKFLLTRDGEKIPFEHIHSIEIVL